MRGNPGLGVHDVQLAMIAARIGGNENLDGFRSGFTRAQQIESLDAEERIDQRLRRDRADARGDMRHQGPDREEPRRYRNAELSAAPVAGDDRPGHDMPLRSEGWSMPPMPSDKQDHEKHDLRRRPGTSSDAHAHSAAVI